MKKILTRYEITKRYRSNPINKLKRNARRRVEYHITRGYIRRGNCVICGKRKAQAHHPNYLEPLKIVWLCIKHHQEYEQKHPPKVIKLKVIKLKTPYQIARCERCEILLKYAPKGTQTLCGDCVY